MVCNTSDQRHINAPESVDDFRSAEGLLNATKNIKYNMHSYSI